MNKKQFQKGKNRKPNNNSNNNKKPIFRNVMKGGKREEDEIKQLLEKYPSINVKNIDKFNDFPMSRKTLLGLKKCNYTKPTEIQQQSIGYGLQGRDVLGSAITG